MEILGKIWEKVEELLKHLYLYMYKNAPYRSQFWIDWGYICFILGIMPLSFLRILLFPGQLFQFFVEKSDSDYYWHFFFFKLAKSILPFWSDALPNKQDFIFLYGFVSCYDTNERISAFRDLLIDLSPEVNRFHLLYRR